jgi:hypothetical protein
MQNLTHLLPVIALLFTILVVIIIALFASKKDQERVRKLVEEIENDSPFRRSNPQAIRPHNDPLARNKLAEKRRQEELESNVSVYDPRGLTQKSRQEDVQIVGIAEPKGFWSRFIMSQKLGYIMARLNSQSSNKGSGFWTNLIKAQAASQGKDQGRGR